MLKPDSVYGYASHDDVEEAMTQRLASAMSKKDLAIIASEAVAALSDINQSIPVQSRHRHLVAGGLENFANGS